MQGCLSLTKTLRGEAVDQPLIPVATVSDLDPRPDADPAQGHERETGCVTAAAAVVIPGWAAGHA